MTEPFESYCDQFTVNGKLNTMKGCLVYLNMCQSQICDILWLSLDIMPKNKEVFVKYLINVDILQGIHVKKGKSNYPKSLSPCWYPIGDKGIDRFRLV